MAIVSLKPAEKRVREGDAKPLLLLLAVSLCCVREELGSVTKHCQKAFVKHFMSVTRSYTNMQMVSGGQKCVLI